MAMHVCQTPINAVVPESQRIVSNPKQMKNGRVDVVDRGWVITIPGLKPHSSLNPMRHTPTNTRPQSQLVKQKGL